MCESKMLKVSLTAGNVPVHLACLSSICKESHHISKDQLWREQESTLLSGDTPVIGEALQVNHKHFWELPQVKLLCSLLHVFALGAIPTYTHVPQVVQLRVPSVATVTCSRMAHA